ncbi:MAG: hypothetical protein D6758_13625 [Gammaproteobacteria bacterium]|nr:MAG: hypothetical protein D6758_13625 [Gammaproteobacteria bacterium]
MDHLTLWHLIALALGTALITVALSACIGYWLYRTRLKPEKERLEQALQTLSGEIETSIEKGIRRGVKKALAELPSAAAKQTTQSVTRVGTDLIERGLSSLIDRPSRRKPPGE